MLTLTKIQDLLNDAGISYETNDNFIISSWKIDTIELKILLFINDSAEWLNILSAIDKIGELKKLNKTSQNIEQILLRLNYKIKGIKFSINNEFKIVCMAELFYLNLDSETLKITLTQMVKAINYLFSAINRKVKI